MKHRDLARLQDLDRLDGCDTKVDYYLAYTFNLSSPRHSTRVRLEIVLLLRKVQLNIVTCKAYRDSRVFSKR